MRGSYHAFLQALGNQAAREENMKPASDEVVTATPGRRERRDGGGAEPGRLPIVARADVPHDAPDAMRRLLDELGPGPFAFVGLFVTPEADFAAVSAEAAVAYPSAQVVACTTAGEIGRGGYLSGAISAIALPTEHFAAVPVAIPALQSLDSDALMRELFEARNHIAATAPLWSEELAFLVIDGLSIREDETAAAISTGLGPVPLFGGSAGDATRFEETFVSLNGEVMKNAAVLTLIRTDCEVEVFSLDHLEPQETRMVVTKADPARRLVQEINGEPAAREYARLLGKNPDELDTFTFAAHPVVVRVGDDHHVRAIQQVLATGELVFFSAIDHGVVLRLATPANMTTHLQQELDNLTCGREAEALLVCDCILRRVEAEQTQQIRQMGDILARERAGGCSTDGEQIGGLHVNQTMTGAAFFPPTRRSPT